MRRLFPLTLCLLVGACGQYVPPPHKEVVNDLQGDRQFIDKLGSNETAPALELPPPVITTPEVAAPSITTATFEPVVTAAKDVQGAAVASAAYVTFTGLMQAFSTELGVAKGQELNASDRKLLALYQEIFEAYQVSGTLWAATIKFPESKDSNAVPLSGISDEQVAHYKLERTTAGAVAANSMQRVWQQADVLLENATAVFLGRSAPTP